MKSSFGAGVNIIFYDILDVFLYALCYLKCIFYVNIDGYDSSVANVLKGLPISATTVVTLPK